MTSIHPDAELAPRDVVARSVHALRAAGRVVFLDATGVPELETRFPGACRIARAAGFEPHRQPLPVATAAHFHMGGIATDANGASSMTGLWACGEVSSTGLHGANRLASNSLLEGLVFGQRIAGDIRRTQLTPPRGALEVACRPAELHADGRVASLRQLMGASLGPLRTAPAMLEALRQLETWRPASRAEDDRIVVAQQILSAAIERRESRGAHQRGDYPDFSAAAAERSFRRPPRAAVEKLELFRSRVA